MVVQEASVATDSDAAGLSDGAVGGLDLTAAPEGRGAGLAPAFSRAGTDGDLAGHSGWLRGQVRPRSGWALKHGITVLTAAQAPSTRTTVARCRC